MPPGPSWQRRRGRSAVVCRSTSFDRAAQHRDGLSRDSNPDRGDVARGRESGLGDSFQTGSSNWTAGWILIRPRVGRLRVLARGVGPARAAHGRPASGQLSEHAGFGIDGIAHSSNYSTESLGSMRELCVTGQRRRCMPPFNPAKSRNSRPATGFWGLTSQSEVGKVSNPQKPRLGVVRHESSPDHRIRRSQTIGRQD